MSKVKMWVCSACKGVYFPDHAIALGRCPGCSGQGKVQDCERDEAGVVVPLEKA